MRRSAVAEGARDLCQLPATTGPVELQSGPSPAAGQGNENKQSCWRIAGVERTSRPSGRPAIGRLQMAVGRDGVTLRYFVQRQAVQANPNRRTVRPLTLR
jgi:hypothetical protein